MGEVISLLKELMRFKTIASRPDELNRCADFIETFLTNLGVSYERVNSNAIPSILVTPKPGVTPVLLMAHFDVVDGPDALFEPVEREGKIYGRGSVDDKYAVALSLVLLKQWMAKLEKNDLGQESLPFGILLTGDEETGGYDGARHTLKNVQADFALALDGGEPEKIITKGKGILDIKLTAQGKAAHGALPWLGTNAIDILVDDLKKVRHLFEEDAPGHWHKTINTGIIQGGESVNQVCDTAHAVLDIRYTENDDPDAILAEIDRVTTSMVTTEEKEPLFKGGDSPHLQTLLSLIPEAVTGYEHGASDARFLSDYGIPGVIWGARGIMTAHAKDEHVEIESVLWMLDILDRFMTLAYDNGKDQKNP